MKRKEIKLKPKKVKANPNEWLQLITTILKSRRKEMAFLTRLWAQYVKKEKKDPEKEICKEIIQRMDARKVLTEEAQQMAISSATKLQELQKGLPKMLIYLLGGGIMMICSLVFLFLRAPHSSNPLVWLKDINVLMWLILFSINLVVFVLGMRQRESFTKDLVEHSILSQASAAFAASKSPGKGGSIFEAYRYLDLIREKNKEAFDKKYSFNKKK